MRYGCCEDCMFWDNTKPVSTERNSEYKKAEEYIGICKNIGRPKMMSDVCPLFEKREENNNGIQTKE
ncbi:hypothetical protein [Ruminococcus flavefaciens]|uniref:hypothetical protein n=1 Tax=Ruminococcus flavefaciens TaxID=1265 RepID=UPI0026E9F402|nr:hypothetical protein [Ruminococcus flavefaciens]